MTTIGTPRVEWRDRRVYMGKRFIAPFKGMSKEIAAQAALVTAWVNDFKVETVGPPFLRYHVIDMRGLMDLSYCVPVLSAGSETSAIMRGELPEGEYAALTFSGGGIAGNRALIEWARAKGLKFDRWDTSDGDTFKARYETYLTDPKVEPRKSKWEIEVAIKLLEEEPAQKP